MSLENIAFSFALWGILLLGTFLLVRWYSDQLDRTLRENDERSSRLLQMAVHEFSAQISRIRKELNELKKDLEDNSK